MTTNTRKTKKPLSPPERAAHVLGHRIRVEALTILIERASSSKLIAAEIGESVQLVAYHLKIMREEEAIELVKTVPRGAVSERFYRATMRPELTHEEWVGLSMRHKQELAVIGVRNLFAESLSSIETGRMVTDEEAYYWWKAVPLDALGREEIRKEQDAHTARILEIEAKANARLVESQGSHRHVPTVVAVLGFDRGRQTPVSDTYALNREDDQPPREH